MRGIILVLFLGCINILPADAKGKMTYITAEIQGYDRDMIYFDFMEKEGINTEIPYQENQPMEIAVELDDITMLRINTWIYICLQPGDSIHAKILYEGKYHKTVEYTGSPEAVAICTALQEMRAARRACRYKANMPAALVTLVEAKEYYTMTLEEWKKEVGILDQVKDRISPNVYNYVLSELDGVFLSNLIYYPYMSAAFNKKKIEDCIADGYWDVLDSYTPRGDEASLRNRGYMSFLQIFKDYVRRKEAGNKAEAYASNRSLEEEYADLADFYDGSLRDASLFVLLYNAIANSGDFKVIEKLRKDYLKKYNKNKEYKKILADVMK